MSDLRTAAQQALIEQYNEVKFKPDPHHKLPLVLRRPGTYPRQQVRLHHKALIWFSANPDEYLTLQDMKDKWGGSLDAISTGLRYAVDAGLLTKTRHPDDTSPNGRRTRYEAGPAIRLVLGLEDE